MSNSLFQSNGTNLLIVLFKPDETLMAKLQCNNHPKLNMKRSMYDIQARLECVLTDTHIFNLQPTSMFRTVLLKEPSSCQIINQIAYYKIIPSLTNLILVVFNINIKSQLFWILEFH